MPITTFSTRRAWVTIRALAERGHTIHIVTTAPQRLFSDLVEQFPERVSVRFRNVDPGVVQSDAVSVDVEKSFEVLGEVVGGVEGGVEGEVEWLRGLRIGCVVLDAGFLPAVAAKTLGIPSILVTNFTFDAIYEWIARVGNEEDERLCRLVRGMYGDVGYLLRLPGTIPIPAFDVSESPIPVAPPSVEKDGSMASLFSVDSLGSTEMLSEDGRRQHHRSPSLKLGDTTKTWRFRVKSLEGREDHVMDLPLVVRMRRREREEVRRELGIALDAKVLLITFGGFAVGKGEGRAKVVTGSDGALFGGDRSVAEPDDEEEEVDEGNPWTAEGILPEGWIGVFAVPTGAGEVTESLGKNRFLAAPSGSYVPDLVGAVDCVAGKCGYSTCAEVVAHGVPFVYVPRPQFAEEAGLLGNLMEPFGIAVEMPQRMFYAGKWSKYVMKAYKLGARGPRAKIPVNGDQVAALAIESLVAGKGLKDVRAMGFKTP
ncbi:hypothetical protein HDU97_009362 [Phlyctochytrium planicorne]|nr:hypothetical protein HDU97_009362 [Phlyctochytrium planicorne]